MRAGNVSTIRSAPIITPHPWKPRTPRRGEWRESGRSSQAGTSSTAMGGSWWQSSLVCFTSPWHSSWWPVGCSSCLSKCWVIIWVRSHCECPTWRPRWLSVIIRVVLVSSSYFTPAPTHRWCSVPWNVSYCYITKSLILRCLHKGLFLLVTPAIGFSMNSNKGTAYYECASYIFQVAWNKYFYTFTLLEIMVKSRTMNISSVWPSGGKNPVGQCSIFTLKFSQIVKPKNLSRV